MKNPDKSWFCYLPQSPEAEAWGLYVLNAGYTVIPPNTPYPPGQHPDDHISVATGRTLDTFAFVYITRGNGTFESRSGGKHTISEGDLFILFPGEQHRYQPDPTTGWDEYWVEFDGEQAHRIMSNEAFSLKKPVLPIGADDQILRLFIEIAEATQTQPPGFEHIIAAQASQIVARILARLLYSSAEAREMETLIRRARLHIMRHAEQTIDCQQLARELGISYSAFRHRFKQITGLPPGQYQIQIRLNKARSLLRNSPLSVADIAAQLGFESIYYFSRLFKKKTGLSPREWRNLTAPDKG